MFGVMRAAYVLERAHPDGAWFTVGEALRAATLGGAEIAGLADVTGSLTPGKQADLIVLRTDTLGMAAAHDPVTAVVLSGETRHVDTVLVGGRVLKRGGVLQGHDLPSVVGALEEAAGRVAAG
jgi:cytosine/adenosine deaminase-related metal-dependent hydrolase